jgi:transposase InsO family protein
MPRTSSRAGGPPERCGLPNGHIWQADHTELDILVKDESGTARRPWLTIIIDDYSRAVAGYFLSLSAPSAIQTALALRQVSMDPNPYEVSEPEPLRA